MVPWIWQKWQYSNRRTLHYWPSWRRYISAAFKGALKLPLGPYSQGPWLLPCTFSDIFTILFLRYGPMNLADDNTVTGEHCIIGPVGGAISQLPLRVRSTGALFTRSLTVIMHIFRHFYCISFKIWSHYFDRYDNTIGEIALLAQLEALYLSCLWGCVKSFTGALFPRSLPITMHIFRHFYCIIFKIWSHEFGRYDNTVTGEHCIIGPVGGAISQLPLRVR